MAGDRKDLKLIVVGARYERDYEIEYVKQVKEAIGDDPRIELHPCTTDVEPFYAQADVLLMTSTNEVTPLTISESMIRGIPVITSDIAGIPDMLTDGVEGYVINLDKKDLWLKRMRQVADNSQLVTKLGLAAASRAKKQYAMEVMIANYRKTSFTLSPPTILIDMDGVLVDWDKGFLKEWGDRPMGLRNKYEMEQCVGEGYSEEAKSVFYQKGFFFNLPPMAGSLEALHAIVSRGYDVKICTRPILSPYCVQEKYAWVEKYLGSQWMEKIVMTSDKTIVIGSLLIDDHPAMKGSRVPSWRQVIFDAPYNRGRTDLPRLNSWDQWEKLFEEELLFAPKLSKASNKKEELIKLPVGKRRMAVIRNLSWPNRENGNDILSITKSSEDEESPPTPPSQHLFSVQEVTTEA
jgi:5'-nucleotidase